MQKVDIQTDSQQSNSHQRLLFLSYSTLASVALSIILALTTHFSSVHGNVEIGKLRTEMTEIKLQMADRGDLQVVRKSLLQLEKDVKNLSDRLPKD